MARVEGAHGRDESHAQSLALHRRALGPPVLEACRTRGPWLEALLLGRETRRCARPRRSRAAPLAHERGALGETPREARPEIGVEPEHVVEDKHLAVAARPGPDADRRDGEGGGDLARERPEGCIRGRARRRPPSRGRRRPPAAARPLVVPGLHLETAQRRAPTGA